MFEEKYMVLDIECWHPNDTIEVGNAQLKYVGLKYDSNRRVFNATEKETIQNAINFCPYLIGHNILSYDRPVLEAHGFVFPKDQIIIDTYKIAENRLKSMMYLDLNKGDMSLRSLAERFHLPSQKKEYDYSKLEKELSKEDYDQLVEYLHADLDTTDELYKYFYNFFFGFKEFMSENNQRKMSWLTCKPGATAYKCICNMAGLKEDYNEEAENTEVAYSGGYVTEPFVDFEQDDIYLYDQVSLYPHMMMGFNLYSPSNDKEYFRGSEIYPTKWGNDIDGIVGHYKKDSLGKIETVIRNLLTTRLSIDEKLQSPLTPREEKGTLMKKKLAIKILINTMYGIMGSPKFKSVYNLTSASDCTALARRTIKHARTVLENAGYICLYTDTDSIFIKDPFKNEDKLRGVASYISGLQRANFNIDIPTHQLKLESKIRRIYFFKGDDGKYIKKHYIYVTDKNEIVVKGLKIKQGNCSQLSKQFYHDIIIQDIINNRYAPYTAQQVLDKLKELALVVPEKLLKRYRVNSPDTYKKGDGQDEATGLQYQIAKRYGAGEHWLVINKRIGAGKVNKYATMDELIEKYGSSWINQVCFDIYMKELSEFIRVEDRNKITKIDRKRKVANEAEENRSESI